MTNQEFANQKWFVVMCKDLCIKATARQASKFRMGKGLLFKFNNGSFNKSDLKNQ